MPIAFVRIIFNPAEHAAPSRIRQFSRHKIPLKGIFASRQLYGQQIVKALPGSRHRREPNDPP